MGGLILTRSKIRFRMIGTVLSVFVAGIGLVRSYNEPNDVLALRVGITGVALLFLFLFYPALFRRWKRRRYLRSSLKKIDRFSGEEFEEYLCAVFRHRGYRVETTDASHDFGADLIASRSGYRMVVQAKRYQKNVGVEAVQQVIGSMRYYDADYAMVVTNSYFTASAIKLAEANDVLLWDRDQLEAIREGVYR